MTRDARAAGRATSSRSCCAGSARETDETAVKQLPVYVQIAIDQFAHPRERDGAARDLGVGPARADRGRGAGQRPPAHLRQGLRRHHRQAGPAVVVRRRGPQRRGPRLPGRACSTARVELDGPRRDADLRWALLTALAAHGRADAARVARGAGPRPHHLRPGAGRRRARGASRPRRPRRRPGSDAAVSDDVCRTRRSAASPTSSTPPASSELLAPYLERYLAVGRHDLGGQGHADRLDDAGVHVPARADQPGDARPGRRLAGDLDGEPGREALRRARPGTTSSGPWPPRPPTPDRAAGTAKGRTRGCGPVAGVPSGPCAQASCRTCGRRACSASCCTPRVMPPTRSPAAKAVFMVSTASSTSAVVERPVRLRRR